MRVLAIGDVCGSVGCHALSRLLPPFKKANSIDLVIVNGENSADGNGITKASCEALFAYGADVITGGNHSMRREQSLSLLDESPFVLRPDNLPVDNGHGYCLMDLGYLSVAVINLSGQIYLDSLSASSPFAAADRLVERAKQEGARCILLDFHAEATSEKRALGLSLDGRISAFFGTHTHVLTHDAQVLPGGTGYITDLGMTGPIQSVLGVESRIIIERLRDRKTNERFVLADGPCMLNGCVFEIDKQTGRCISAKAVCLKDECGLGGRNASKQEVVYEHS